MSRRIHETFLGVVVQMAKGVGVTPWTVLSKGNQLFSGIVVGGGLQVTKLGPKDAQIEIARLPLLEIIGMFARRAHVRIETARSRSPGQLTMLHTSWV